MIRSNYICHYSQKKKSNGETVAVVGAGISGLMNAFALLKSGFKIFLYAKGPDPRKNHQAEQYSSTGNGEIGRFISRFEGEHYLGDTPMYPDMKGAFQNHVAEGGWLGKYKKELTDFDKKWIAERIAACDNQKEMDRTEKFYVDGNKEAMDLWQKLIHDFPELFSNTDLLNTGILRLYDNDTLLKWAVRRHEKESAIERSLSKDDVGNDYPYFAEACQQGIIADY
jgi:hypothetical protein